MKLMIVGSGYVGLVAGACLSELGHDIVCVDRDATKIAGLRAGVMPIFEPGLEELVLRNAAAGRLTFASDLAELNNGIEAVFIAVGTPPSSIDQSADLSSVFAVARDVARASSTGLVIVTKSTVPVGTGDEIAGIMRSTAPTLRFQVASNPEFLREGNAIGDFMAPDRIVIGVEDEGARDVLERVYAPLTARGAPLLSTARRAAELVKYASNCFLAAKISFINEVADLCEAVDADIDEVAAGMGLDRRIGSAFLNAGPGYGGSCFPKDCDAMLATANDVGVKLDVISSAVTSNDKRKNAMARRVVRAMGGDVENKVVAILGLTFKANTDDVRVSPALALIDGLKQEGLSVRVFDPQGMGHARRLLTDVKFSGSALDACSEADCVVIATEWPAFRDLDARTLAKVMTGRTIVDLRNLIDRQAYTAEGFVVHSIGRTARVPVRGAVAQATGQSQPAKPRRARDEQAGRLVPHAANTLQTAPPSERLVMTSVARIAIALALACQAVALPLAGKSFAAEETRRLCDRRVTYNIVPPVGVPAELGRLSGVWRGTIAFAGGSEMCVSMVVKEVFPDGRVILAMAWNVSIGGREDINNFVGMGDAPNWPNKVENGELRIDSGTKWNGTHYYYVMKLPTAANPDVMEGRWMTENHPQPVVLYRDKGR